MTTQIKREAALPAGKLDVAWARQESIHPRVYFSEDKRRKLNTCKPKDKGVTKRKIAAMEAHLLVHPRDAVTERHIANLRATL